MDNQKQYVPTLEAGLVIFLTFFVSMFVGAVVLLTLGNGPALVIGEVFILLIPLGYLLKKRVEVKSYIKINLAPKYILIGIGCAGLLLLLNIVSSVALTAVFGTSQAIEDSNTLLADLSGSPSGLIFVVMSLSLAGVCEEFALRGFLQNTLTRRFSFLPALLISAAVFGLFHFDPQIVYILAAFISGLALGVIYHRWGYVTSATAHSVMNLIVLAFLMLGL